MYYWQFTKVFPLPKNGGHFEFSNFSQKMEKHKFASISLTVQDRAISSKFSTHRVSKQGTIGNFQKFFLSPKMAAILNFRIFAKNANTEICFYLLNRARNFQSTGYLGNLLLPILFQVVEQNSCFSLGGHYACQYVLFLVNYHFGIIFYVS